MAQPRRLVTGTTLGGILDACIKEGNSASNVFEFLLGNFSSSKCVGGGMLETGFGSIARKQELVAGKGCKCYPHFAKLIGDYSVVQKDQILLFLVRHFQKELFQRFSKFWIISCHWIFGVHVLISSHKVLNASQAFLLMHWHKRR